MKEDFVEKKFPIEAEYVEKKNHVELEEESSINNKRETPIKKIPNEEVAEQYPKYLTGMNQENFKIRYVKSMQEKKLHLEDSNLHLMQKSHSSDSFKESKINLLPEGTFFDL